jgi:hypothetical protein
MERRNRAGGVEGDMAGSPAAALPFLDRETPEEHPLSVEAWSRGRGWREGTCHVLQFTWGSVGTYNLSDRG